MEMHKPILPYLPFFLAFLAIPAVLEVHGQISSIVSDNGSKMTKFQAYIIHVQKPKGTKFLSFRDRKTWYMSFLPNNTLDDGESRMIYTYRHAISGFAATLTPDELVAMEAKDGFLLAYPDEEIQFRTTYTPEFLGLSRYGGLWLDTGMGEGEIIGMIDSGIKHNHPSFSDQGMAPPPTTWNGTCYWRRNGCNNKLIGAVGFNGGNIVTPVDRSGHGTHTASTAAGAFVEDANVLGEAFGTASGTAPGAHLAIYKVDGLADMLKGVDEAIRDHVTVLSMSLGTPFFIGLDHDPIAVGSFAAVTRGIVPCQAGGNDGPFPSTMVDGAPWILTVGSGTTDRRIKSIVRLGDNREFYGESGYQPDTFSSEELPLVYPYAILKTPLSLRCGGKSLNKTEVKDKIVLCSSSGSSAGNVAISKLVKKAGAAAVIIMSEEMQGNHTFADPFFLPASHVTYNDSAKIVEYVSNSSSPTATIIFDKTQFRAHPTPTVSYFSSRGPFLAIGNVIKPDVIAPGSNIVAAWPFEVGPNATRTNGTEKTFSIQSGTSMATPHVSGIAAILKQGHPDWSAAAIKSAIMTTAYTKDTDGNPIKDQYDGKDAGVFSMGAGHIDPVAANEPGLVYDIAPHDYIRYLCGMNFTDNQVTAIVRGRVSCSNVHSLDSEQLNLPSIALSLGPGSDTKTINRTVTNVGEANSVYTVTFDRPEGVEVEVEPFTLAFTQTGEKQRFSVKFSILGNPPAAETISEGQLSWDSGKYLVRSPIAITFTG